MTCNEIQLFLSGSRIGNLPIEAAIHLEQCTACRHAVAAHDKLRSDLRLLRESAPAVPESLDCAVVDVFRRTVCASQHGATVQVFVSLRSSASSVLKAGSSTRRQAGTRFAFAAMVAAFMILAVMFMASRQREQVLVWHAPVPHAPEVARTRTAEAPKSRPLATAKRSHSSPVTTEVATRHSGTHPDGSAPAPVAGFQSLMFCDPLSCPGPMDVVRIQIPASAVNRFPAAHMANGYVQADVVVGSDGFARAIRIVH